MQNGEISSSQVSDHLLVPNGGDCKWHQRGTDYPSPGEVVQEHHRGLVWWWFGVFWWFCIFLEIILFFSKNSMGFIVMSFLVVFG